MKKSFISTHDINKTEHTTNSTTNNKIKKNYIKKENSTNNNINTNNTTNTDTITNNTTNDNNNNTNNTNTITNNTTNDNNNNTNNTNTITNNTTIDNNNTTNNSYINKNHTNKTNKITVNKTKRNTTCHITPIKTQPGKHITIRAVIRSITGEFVREGKVSFKINGKTIGTAKIVNGIALFEYDIPSNMKYAIYTINAVFGDTNSYNYCRSNGTLLLKQGNSNNNVPSEYQKYLKPSKNCEVNDYRIQKLSKKFTTSNYSSDYDKAVAIFNYLNKITSYRYYSNTRYGAVGTLERGYGNCVDMSHLLISVMRASGLPARYVHSTSCTFNSGLTVGHVWAEVHVNGKWYTCDLTSNKNKFGVISNWHSARSITRYISLPF